MKYSLCTFILAITVISFMGWIVENLWLAVTKGYIDNRSMTLPFLLGYGLFIAVLYLVIGTPHSLTYLVAGKSKKAKLCRCVIYFFLAMLIVSIGEIILGTLVERVCGFYYWNYEWIPLHITKYTSIPTSSGFALGITFFMGKCFLPLMDALSRLPLYLSAVLALFFTITLSADFLISFRKMYQNHNLNRRWEKELSHPHLIYRIRFRN